MTCPFRGAGGLTRRNTNGGHSGNRAATWMETNKPGLTMYSVSKAPIGRRGPRELRELGSPQASRSQLQCARPRTTSDRSCRRRAATGQLRESLAASCRLWFDSSIVYPDRGEGRTRRSLSAARPLAWMCHAIARRAPPTEQSNHGGRSSRSVLVIVLAAGPAMAYRLNRPFRDLP
jgi:hypothetical protein